MAKVLVADDDAATRLLLERTLQGEGHDVITTPDGSEAWALVRSRQPDVIICDWMMPGLNGVELCRRIRRDPALQALYLILITSKEQTEDKIAALEAGADEFLSKPLDIAELRARIKVGLRILDYQKRLREMALTDDLTGLPNRRAFHAALKREIDRSRRFSTPLALVIIDIDRFKEINDRFGHDKGDAVLQLVARRIASLIAFADMTFRIGGDEFAILLPMAESEARSVVERLKAAFGEPKPSRGPDVEHPTISVGFAVHRPGESADDLFRRADASMYRDKRRSTNETGGGTSASQASR